MGVPAPDNYFRIEPYGSKVAVARGPSHVCNIWENMSQYLLLNIGTFRPLVDTKKSCMELIYNRIRPNKSSRIIAHRSHAQVAVSVVSIPRRSPHPSPKSCLSLTWRTRE